MTRKLAVGAVILAAAGLAAAPTFGLDEAALSALLEAARGEMKMPGLRAAVVDREGALVRAAVGLGDVEAGIPLDDEIGMPGGSTGKTFVAALAMLLVEDGVLSLDDPASQWLGDSEWFGRLPNAGDIRVRHLLSHSAGLADYPGRPGFLFAMVRRVLRHGSAYFEPEELIRFALDRKPLFPPGYREPGETEWHYGFGVFVHEQSRSFGHGGLWSGYRTHVAHFLRSGLTIAVQTNRDGRVDLESLVVRIARLAAAQQAPVVDS